MRSAEPQSLHRSIRTGATLQPRALRSGTLSQREPGRQGQTLEREARPEAYRSSAGFATAQGQVVTVGWVWGRASSTIDDIVFICKTTPALSANDMSKQVHPVADRSPSLE